MTKFLTVLLDGPCHDFRSLHPAWWMGSFTSNVLKLYTALWLRRWKMSVLKRIEKWDDISLLLFYCKIFLKKHFLHFIVFFCCCKTLFKHENILCWPENLCEEVVKCFTNKILAKDFPNWCLYRPLTIPSPFLSHSACWWWGTKSSAWWHKVSGERWW